MSKRRPHHALSAAPPTFLSRSSRFIDRSFQWRYARLVIYTVIATLLVVSGPVVYLANQNFKLFQETAYLLAPSVVSQLEQEITLLNIWFLLASGLVIVVGSWWAFRSTQKIIGPIKVLQNHLRELMKGRFDTAPVKTRKNDEFSDVIDDYNYFVKTFVTVLHRETEDLREIFHKQDKESLDRLGRLIQQRYQQFNDSSAADFESRDSRRAS